ncbi:serine hydrolase domain-containing protein [Amycolatopsis dongchuanensis]|uniref:Serine hydrolase domain-containing protein n=2 Tax=Amycolatopsis dongchuanensis TaxID=1070866 RepID=A0ABP8VR08_9PSEU
MMRGAVVGLVALVTLNTGVGVAAQDPLRLELRAAIDRTVLGAALRWTDHGRTWTATAGSARADRRQQVPADGTYRIGSITKAFVATVVLQLADEGRLGLDEPLRRYLPDALPPAYRLVTVRELLQHTSGVPDYRPEVMADAESALRDRWRQWRPAELVAIATAHPPLAEPGTALSYANTNYVLLGLLIRQVTGRSWAQEVTDRLIRPLRLVQTTVPETDPRLPGHHAHGYATVDQGLVDITDISMTAIDAAGSIISTPSDVDRFFAALLGGRLLSPTTLADMLRPFPGTLGGVAGYGLGVMTLQLPDTCGGTTLYGHGGGTFGFAGLVMASADGSRRLVVSFNTTRFDEAASPLPKLLAITDAAFCGRS